MTPTDPTPVPAEPVPLRPYSYRAQTVEGHAVSGSINAADHADARQQLESLNLRIIDLQEDKAPAPARPIRGEDFIAFNQQLAQLTASGLPVEQGLRLIAEDMRSGKLASTVRAVADDLERGTPLGEAFDRHRGRFPSLYGRLVDAGVRAHNLPAMLLNLGMHAEMIHRLRSMIWRAVAYPLMVMVGLAGVIVFAVWWVIPQFEEMFVAFGTELPGVTKLALALGRAGPGIVLTLAVIAGAAVLAGLLVRSMRAEQSMVDHVLLHVPLVGPALRRNRIARWCDAMKLGVLSGLDIPSAVDLAGDAIGSPLLRRDGAELVQHLSEGRPIELAARFRLIPATVPAAMTLGVRQNQLAETLATLAAMYQQQAETCISLIPAILTPLLLMLIAGIIGFLIAALFAPMVTLISAVSGW